MNKFQLDFVHVGPQRTATSWLDKLLRDHPQFCFPVDVKETRFFDLHYDKGLDWYAWHFRHARPGQLCGEIAPTYFNAPGVAERLRSLNPQLKVMITLRDPVTRAFSLYRHHIYRGHASGTFMQAATSLPHLMDAGRYSVHIPKWLDLLGSNVSFIVFDDIIKNPQQVVAQVCSFLGVEAAELQPGVKETNPVPRSLTAARIGVRAANLLRGLRLHKIVEAGKALGVNKLFLSGGTTKVEGPTLEEQRWILAQNEPDIAYLESLLKRDLSAWRRI